MTSGAAEGTSGSGRRALLAGYVAAAVVTLVINTVNVLSVLHDAARDGDALPWWEPVVWEATSGSMVLVLAWIAYAAVRTAPPENWRSVRFAAVHVGAMTLFSAAHIAGMVGLRIGVYALLNERYAFGLSLDEVLYEYRKDIVGYLLLVATFWVALRLTAAAPVAEEPTSATPSPMFDIVDAGRVVRVPVGEILCVRSAGNYVEFCLIDGRRPLMRSTLGRIAERLAGHGFVRTHRSWLINRAHVREIRPEGSGDYQIMLDGAVSAPLSRRFPETLLQLRGANGA